MSIPAVTGPARSAARTPRIAVSAAFFCQGFAFASLVTRIPAIKDEFALSDGQLAALLALIPIVAGIGSVVAGNLAVRLHSALILRIGGLLVSLTLIAVGAATTGHSFWLLLAALFVLGFGLGSVDATMNMQGIAVQHVAKRSIMASFHAWWSLATILGALAASAAAATTMSLLEFFLVIAICLVVILLVAAPKFLRSAESDDAGPDPLASNSTVPWRPLLVFGAAVVGAFVIDSSVSNWSAVDLTQVLGSTESVAALAYAAYAIFMLVGRAATDRLVTAYGPKLLVASGGIIAAVGLLGVAIAPSEVLTIAAFAVIGLGLSPVLPLAFVAASAHDPHNTGVAVARVNVGNYIGFVLGAPLVGVIGEFSSLRWGFGVLILVAIAISFTAPSFTRSAPAVVMDATPQHED